MSDKLKIKNKRGCKQICFKAFEVGVSISSERESLLEKIVSKLDQVFPNGFEEIDEQDIEHHFFIKAEIGDKFDLYKNDEKVFGNSTKADLMDSLASQLRITIAEFAVSKVFLHAGVVGWKGKAIVFPANSFAGKTTLVAELIKRGALYYSDEYAVLDQEGNVQPYPKMLSLRGIIDDYRQVDFPVESLGGTAGNETIPIGMVLITEYDAEVNSETKKEPEILSHGQGIMEILAHTISLRNEPEFALQVLNKVASRAIIVRIVRGDAPDFAIWLLNYFESQIA